MALLARRAVGDVAHRIDGFKGGAAGNQGAPAFEPAAGAKKIADGGDDIVGLGHAAEAELAASHVPFHGADKKDAALPKQLKIGGRGGVVPHADVHRRRRQYRFVGGEKDRGRQTVGQAMRHFGQDIGRRRRHQHQVGLPRQADMPHLAFVGELKQVLVNLLAAERGERQGGDEPGAALAEHATHGGALGAQTADGVQALVGGDAARNDQKDAFSIQHATSPQSSRLGAEIFN